VALWSEKVAEESGERKCKLPCYTQITVQVKDKGIAEKALKKMGAKANITKNADGTFTVTPEKQTAEFKEEFLTEYAVALAEEKARMEGYDVVREYNQETGETELTLRQY
jgi:hypothetical protein